MRETFFFRTRTFPLAVAVLALVTLGTGRSVADAAEPDVDQPFRPAHAAQTMVVPDGFNAELMASVDELMDARAQHTIGSGDWSNGLIAGFGQNGAPGIDDE